MGRWSAQAFAPVANRPIPDLSCLQQTSWRPGAATLSRVWQPTAQAGSSAAVDRADRSDRVKAGLPTATVGRCSAMGAALSRPDRRRTGASGARRARRRVRRGAPRPLRGLDAPDRPRAPPGLVPRQCRRRMEVAAIGIFISGRAPVGVGSGERRAHAGSHGRARFISTAARTAPAVAPVRARIRVVSHRERHCPEDDAQRQAPAPRGRREYACGRHPPNRKRTRGRDRARRLRAPARGPVRGAPTPRRPSCRIAELVLSAVVPGCAVRPTRTVRSQWAGSVHGPAVGGAYRRHGLHNPRTWRWPAPATTRPARAHEGKRRGPDARPRAFPATGGDSFFQWGPLEVPSGRGARRSHLSR